MRNHSVKNMLSAVVLMAVGYVPVSLAHTVSGPLDFSGVGASASDLITVDCFNDSNGDADHLVASVEDLSPPQASQIVSLQITKDNKMTNTSDTSSAAGGASPDARLQAGNGTYRISLTKTAAGVRNVNVTYHCETSSGAHTGTGDLGVLQLQ